MSDVTYEIDGTVAIVSFNRPDQLNAMTRELETAYLDALEQAEKDDAVRAVVVTGAGKAFSAGADIAELRTLAEHGGSAMHTEERGRMVALELAKPVVAAVNGPTVGMGLVHALACDVRIASTRASFVTGFSGLGLVAEQAISWLLPQVAGRAVALDMLLSSRAVAADEALRTGLVSQVLAPEELLPGAVEYAGRLGRTISPYSVEVIKKQVTRDAVRQLPEVVREADELTSTALDGPHFREGVAAMLERRRPVYPAVVR